jgi:hypothetical protein
MTRREFLVSAAAAPLFAGREWEDPAFPDWSRAHIDRVLSDSPWARQKTVPFVHPERDSDRSNEFSFSQITLPGGIGFPRRGGNSSGYPLPTSRGVRTEAYLTVRWSTALPVRQALVLVEFGKGGFQDPRAQETLAAQPQDYVLDIAGFPAILFSRHAKQLESDLSKTARLYLRGRKALAPTSVGVPEHGNHLAATLRFPRWADVDESGTVEFTAQTGTMKIEVPFKLKPMVYRGRLEI